MPFVKCPECGKLNSVKLKNCPKCEASLDMAHASYNHDTQSIMPEDAANAATQQPGFWGQPVQQHPQNNPWGQPVQQQTPRQSQNNTVWGQPISQNTVAVTHCPTCGNQIIPGARFCGSCGTPVAVQQQQPAGIPTRKNPYCL